MTRAARSDTTWVFGYGSLIYKVDFPYQQKATASISGWERRFWQGSHDHRGTPCAPGRVVTLIPSPGATCRGVAYLVEQEVFEHLDHREKNGYERYSVTICLDEKEVEVDGLIYVATEDNHAYLGPAHLEEVASHISRSHGPSGSNTDYVLQLARALRKLGDHDPHVYALEALLTQ
ncbi:MAG: gamma-glutamylcyclotransferase [Haliea sp.]|jgi:cation transport regulator ChaC|nr:gamma-glutamylcyclotransferase [Haliea sp.]